LPATLIHSELGATAPLAGVAVVFAIGECVHGVVLGPLVADLAPPHLLGRYLSMYALMASRRPCKQVSPTPEKDPSPRRTRLTDAGNTAAPDGLAP